MTDPTDSAAARRRGRNKWWLLECAHYGYGDPTSFMVIICEVCGRKRRRVVREAESV